MKICITGALGHIGSRLIRELPVSFKNSKLILIDNLLTQRYNSLFNLPDSFIYKFIEGDLRKLPLKEILTDVDIVIHLAAMTDAADSFNKENVVEENNYQSTKLVAEAALEKDVKMIHLSSTSVYGTQKEVVDEDCSDEDLQPQSPYAETKLKEEGLVKDLVNNRGLKAISLRLGTIFGISPGIRFHTAVN